MARSKSPAARGRGSTGGGSGQSEASGKRGSGAGQSEAGGRKGGASTPTKALKRSASPSAREVSKFSYLTESVYKVVLQKSISAQIRQLFLYISNLEKD